ncbi:MAG: hypothetical protein J0H73_04740, partial [Salana multivorans]|nr:hypothetical protein [Salana multivorans]
CRGAVIVSSMGSETIPPATSARQNRRISRELGRTVVVVLHDVNFAGHYADWICAVKDGVVARFGAPEEVFTGDVLTDVFDTPVQIVDGPQGPIAVYF